MDNTDYTALLNGMYVKFNERDINGVLAQMQPGVKWPNGWEGGYVHGYDEVRDYWTRQWAVLNPIVTPEAFTELEDGRIDTLVKQVVKDLQGNTVFNGFVKHIYTIKDGLICTMEIEAV